MLRRIAHPLLVLLLTAVAAVALLAVPALATEDEPAPAESGPVEFAPGEEPAVEVDLFAEEESVTPQWTYRFLIPITITLAVIVVAMTVVMYFVRVVRARYQVQ